MDLPHAVSGGRLSHPIATPRRPRLIHFTHSAFNERIQEALLEHRKFTPPAKTEKVKLVQGPLEDVGLSNPGVLTELTRRAAAEGLKLFPLYLAAYLRLAYLDQPEGPYLTIASEKPEQDENYPNGFYMRNFEKTLWLRGYRADDTCEWPATNKFIFMKDESTPAKSK